MAFSTSDSTEKLDTALAKAQGELHAALKESVNPAFRSKYANIKAIVDACRPALAKHLISVTQWITHSDDDRLHIVTRIALAGEWMKAEFSIPVLKRDAHGYGSAVTYARRFALAAALGIVSDEEDDDGNGAADGQEKPYVPYQPKAPAKGGYVPREPQGSFSESPAHIQSHTTPRQTKIVDAMKKHSWKTPQVMELIAIRFKKKTLVDLTDDEFLKVIQVVELQPSDSAIRSAKAMAIADEGDLVL
jgi:hypothetical protein